MSDMRAFFVRQVVLVVFVGGFREIGKERFVRNVLVRVRLNVVLVVQTPVQEVLPGLFPSVG
jgi:hypothetical protein